MIKSGQTLKTPSQSRGAGDGYHDLHVHKAKITFVQGIFKDFWIAQSKKWVFWIENAIFYGKLEQNFQT